jgi:hypothetical protein
MKDNKKQLTEPNVIKVERIVLTVSGRELSLTPDEARKLQGALNGLLGSPQPVYIYPYVTAPATVPEVAPWPWPFSPTCTGDPLPQDHHVTISTSTSPGVGAWGASNGCGETVLWMVVMQSSGKRVVKRREILSRLPIGFCADGPARLRDAHGHHSENCQ